MANKCSQTANFVAGTRLIPTPKKAKKQDRKEEEGQARMFVAFFGAREASTNPTNPKKAEKKGWCINRRVRPYPSRLLFLLLLLLLGCFLQSLRKAQETRPPARPMIKAKTTEKVDQAADQRLPSSALRVHAQRLTAWTTRTWNMAGSTRLANRMDRGSEGREREPLRAKRTLHTMSRRRGERDGFTEQKDRPATTTMEHDPREEKDFPGSSVERFTTRHAVENHRLWVRWTAEIGQNGALVESRVSRRHRKFCSMTEGGYQGFEDIVSVF